MMLPVRDQAEVWVEGVRLERDRALVVSSCAIELRVHRRDLRRWRVGDVLSAAIVARERRTVVASRGVGGERVRMLRHPFVEQRLERRIERAERGERVYRPILLAEVGLEFSLKALDVARQLVETTVPEQGVHAEDAHRLSRVSGRVGPFITDENEARRARPEAAVGEPRPVCEPEPRSRSSRSPESDRASARTSSRAAPLLR